MSKHMKKGLVPKLRFPEFRDAGAWEEKTLDTIGYFTGGGTPSKENTSYWAGDIPWISSSDISEESIFQINISRFITEAAIRESATKIVPANSILLISRVGVGKLAISMFPLCTSQDFTNFTPTCANLLFLAYLLKSRKETLLSFNQGTSIRGFTKDNIATLELGLPLPTEQQRIADCLSSLDAVIAAQSEKLDALKTHKKGLMQQLFPRDDETVPRLRFPEFRDAGEWKIKKLSDVAELITEKAGNKKFILMSITAGVGLVSQLDKFGREIAGTQYKNYYVIRKNDFAYNKSATKDYPEGFIDMYSVDAPGAVPNSIFTCFKVNPKEVVPRFLHYQFAGNSHGRWLKKFITIGARAHGSLNIDNKDLLALPVPLPKGLSSLNEQQKIADCLSSLDGLIAAHSEKLDALKTHKKGLMQQLFPEVEEN